MRSHRQLLAALCTTLLVVACERGSSSAEVEAKARAEAEAAAARTREALEKAGDAVGEKVDDAVDAASETVDTALDAAGEKVDAAVDKAADAAQQVAEEARAGAGRAVDAVGQEVGRELDDAGLLARVKATLVAQLAADGLTVDADVENGVVTLTGQLPTQAVRERVVNAVRATPGVLRLEDRLTVGASRSPG